MLCFQGWSSIARYLRARTQVSDLLPPCVTSDKLLNLSECVFSSLRSYLTAVGRAEMVTKGVQQALEPLL